MSETKVTLPFADGHYTFWLPMPRIIAAERECDCSILALFYQLGESIGQSVGGAMVLVGQSDARLRACHSIIRNALVGGGSALVQGEDVTVGDAMALELVQTYCYPARPAMHDIALAWEILRAAVYGVQTSDGSKKKDEATGDQKPL